MKSDCILLQHGSNGHEGFLAYTLAPHRRYCERWNINYQATSGDYDLGGRHPMWTKVRLMRDALRQGYERVVWLDADTLIVDIDTDLRTAVPQSQTLKIGVTWHAFDWAAHDLADVCYDHWNTGAVYVAAGVVTERFMEVWWETDDQGHAWHDQHAFNSAEPAIVERLDARWNSIYPLFESPTPVVRHWAGWKHVPERIPFIREAVEALTWI